MFLRCSMPATFEPLVRRNPDHNVIEMFVSGDESMSIMTNIFVSAGVMILAMILTWLFIWSYQKDYHLFISIIALVAFLFALENIIIILVNMSKYEEVSFKISMGSNVLSGIMFLIISIFFFIRFFQTRRQVSSSSYIPTNVQNYIDQ
jgi:membrane protease YdiL (CAAX protease family)